MLTTSNSKTYTIIELLKLEKELGFPRVPLIVFQNSILKIEADFNSLRVKDLECDSVNLHLYGTSGGFEAYRSTWKNVNHPILSQNKTTNHSVIEYALNLRHDKLYMEKYAKFWHFMMNEY